MPFSFEKEKNSKMSFLDVEVSGENGAFVTTLYRKTIFVAAYTHFESFLLLHINWYALYLSIYMFYVMLDWTKFHRENLTSKEIFQRNDYRTSFINKCFKFFFDRLHIMKLTLATMERTLYALCYLTWGSISLLVRINIKSTIKGL